MAFSMKAGNDSQSPDEPNPFALDGDPNIIAVFDGDELAFKIAAACESRAIKAINSTNGSETPFKNRTVMKKFLEGLDVPEDKYAVEDTQEAEPIQNAIVTVKRRMAAIAKKCNAGSYEMYVGDTNNFRNDLPLPVKYKDREDSVRPLLLKDLKNYLREYKDAIWIDGMETDDMISIRMYEGFQEGKKVIGISSDKDQLMTDGWLLAPDKMEEPFLIDGYGGLFIDESVKGGKVKGYGRKWLYWQCGLMGDSVDTYCPRDVYKQLHGKKPTFGEKTAYKLLEPCTDDREALTVVCNQYKKWYGEGDFTYTDWKGNTIESNWRQLLEVYFKAAYMRRFHDDETSIEDYLGAVGL